MRELVLFYLIKKSSCLCSNFRNCLNIDVTRHRHERDDDNPSFMQLNDEYSHAQPSDLNCIFHSDRCYEAKLAL